MTFTHEAKMAGLTLPREQACFGWCYLLSRMKLDPATASGPLVTSIADAAGLYDQQAGSSGRCG
ncbi:MULTISPECIES: magnesium transporter [Pseudomonas]|uniref:Magnesium transporter n=1 Tax=Pseudomonas sp. Hg7Tf TaxID=3236988 RepID=A0AB39HV51_9PSED|nr:MULTISPECIES: magnesium transporter [Pseudomonas]MDD1975879.1 magnesium transporter [Pseudomonas putida]MDH2560384.1 magnesium transporter [Pseudomonas sp. Hg5Tf]